MYMVAIYVQTPTAACTIAASTILTDQHAPGTRKQNSYSVALGVSDSDQQQPDAMVTDCTISGQHRQVWMACLESATRTFTDPTWPGGCIIVSVAIATQSPAWRDLDCYYGDLDALMNAKYYGQPNTVWINYEAFVAGSAAFPRLPGNHRLNDLTATWSPGNAQGDLQACGESAIDPWSR